MIPVSDYNSINLSQIETGSFWNTGEQREYKMHRIHAYPAKFPAFITVKALEFARTMSVTPNRIADIFCGCGTVALEAKRNYIDFWGCDINPVATLIAQVKGRTYQPWRLNRHFSEIVNLFQINETDNTLYDSANDRLKYWYDPHNYAELSKLKSAIEEVTPSNSAYRLFFLCAFSNILKATSRWLTKSIKPQIDPDKTPSRVLESFKGQFNFMWQANNELSTKSMSKLEIITGDFLSDKISCPTVDMIITSPPYVTSYEYADLHQLSSIWLGYTDDYTKLRKGTIGSRDKEFQYGRELKRLNQTGSRVVFRLHNSDKSRARVVAKYYLDISDSIQKCYSILTEGGMAVFVIGDTEYEGIRIENARHLLECLTHAGFKNIQITKRKISGKILTPYRDDLGRFTTDKRSRQVYGEEFILVGFKK